jgi:hypothetical protein
MMTLWRHRRSKVLASSCSTGTGVVVSLLQHADDPMDAHIWAGLSDDLLLEVLARVAPFLEEATLHLGHHLLLLCSGQQCRPHLRIRVVASEQKLQLLLGRVFGDGEVVAGRVIMALGHI